MSSSTSSSSQYRSPQKIPTTPTSLLTRLAQIPTYMLLRGLVFLVIWMAVYATWTIWRTSDPRYVAKFGSNADRIMLSRPAFKNVDRYSNEHRFRPAASPVIKKYKEDGSIYHHGDYHVWGDRGGL